MSASDALLQLLLDEREISRVLTRFSRFLDTRDFESYADLYAEDGELVTPWGTHHGRVGLADHVRGDLGQYLATHHVTAGQEIDVVGDRANVRTTLLATHVTSDAGTAFWSVGGHYVMELVRCDSSWQFLRVHIVPAWRFDTPKSGR